MEDLIPNRQLCYYRIRVLCVITTAVFCEVWQNDMLWMKLHTIWPKRCLGFVAVDLSSCDNLLLSIYWLRSPAHIPLKAPLTITFSSMACQISNICVLWMSHDSSLFRISSYALLRSPSKLITTNIRTDFSVGNKQYVIHTSSIVSKLVIFCTHCWSRDFLSLTSLLQPFHNLRPFRFALHMSVRRLCSRALDQ